MRSFKILFISLCLFYCIQSFGQSGSWGPKDSANFEVNINPDFFLLGTFSDYMGRFEYIDRDKQIDRYYPAEESATRFLAKFIFEHYQISVDTIFEESRHSEMFSEILAHRLHSYYDEKGSLKGDIFDSEEKKYAFVTGAFYRYGTLLQDNIYKIHLYNSSKDREIYALLKDLDCDKIVYKFLRGYTPSSDIFYFEATPRLIKYFNTVKNENKVIRDAQQAQILAIFKGEQKEEFARKYIEEENRLVESLKHIFK